MKAANFRLFLTTSACTPAPGTGATEQADIPGAPQKVGQEMSLT